MTHNQKQQMLSDMLQQVQDKENEFPVIDDKGYFKIPILSDSGIRKGWETYDSDNYPKYKGYVLEVNDHGNVTVWNRFLSGEMREVASRV
jgi:hypothetical protein